MQPHKQEIYLYKCLVGAEVVSGHCSTQVSGNNGAGNKKRDLLVLRPVYTKNESSKSNQNNRIHANAQ